MKILHTADWHLDTPFSGFSGEKRDFLRRELLKIPEKIVKLALREGCDLILIAGDVFDGAYTADSLDAVRNALGNCKLPVFISPGNHDFCAPDSPWMAEHWPENVHIFTGGLESKTVPALDCRIYGAGYSSMDCEPLLDNFRKEGEEKYQIGLIHGDPTSLSSPYSPVTAAQVRTSGLDYLALGHIHKGGSFTAGQTLCAWPGCPMGRGYDELGEKGCYIVDLNTKELRFVAMDTPRFFDLEAETGESAAASLDALLPPVESADFYRVTLTGSGEGSLEELTTRFAHIPNLELRDQRTEKMDIWAVAGEDTLEGVYFQMLHQMLETSDEREAAQIQLAAEISRKLLDGREVTL